MSALKSAAPKPSAPKPAAAKPAALKPTALTGTVIWAGFVANRDAALQSAAADRLTCTFDGVMGEAHGGATRASCSRVLAQYPRGTTIRNVRQLTILSDEELAAIAAAMRLDRLDPAWLGATLVLRGLPDLSHLPPSSRLQAPSGATLVVDMQNRPCLLPARVIESLRPGFGAAFKPAATGLRGVTAWVEREGTIALGDALTLHIPDQRPWAGPDPDGQT